ncbi:MAG: hypothetical protein CVT63_07800 [Candidatus Anoxymicrobium japonicum]|uniref:DUF86 domain-containing protein n=1 Tax=Candidatus Anoxymicrobium japonicum TaxID=2013648 RepID=A0A2N3G419_9ACTN|nr:MAG: hypothetical protein CVT63_07800 [Candidatus Anoxymicrobium japonicum]
MTRHDDDIGLRHMLDYSRRALAMIEGRSREELNTDEMLCLALTRLMEIVGEAATRISRAGQERHERIPWAQIVGLRNRLIHGYDAVDLDILWDIVQQDLPPLIAELQEIVEEP